MPQGISAYYILATGTVLIGVFALATFFAHNTALYAASSFHSRKELGGIMPVWLKDPQC